MKKNIFCMLAAGLIYGTSASAGPLITGHELYDGESVQINWEGTSAFSDTRLNVFYRAGSSAIVAEHFDNVNVTDGKVNTDNPNYPEYFNLNLSKGGGADFVNGAPTLDYDGESIELSGVPGDFCHLKLKFNTYGLETITSANVYNSATLNVRYFDSLGHNVLLGELFLGQLSVLGLTELDLMYQLPHSAPDFNKVIISITTDGTRVGSISFNEIEYAYNIHVTHAEYDVQGLSHTVTGLDPETDYHFILSQSDGSASNTYTVDELLTPTGLEISAADASSFTAAWQPVPKATGYQVVNYALTISDGSPVTIFSDRFANATEGSILSPKSIYPDEADLYTDHPGWSGRNMIVVPGAIGVSAGRYPGNISFLISPSFDLSSADGLYTVTLKAQGTPGNELRVYRQNHLVAGSLNIHSEKFGATGKINATWTMDDGAADMKLQFEESKLAQFVVSELTITQQPAAGSTVMTAVESGEIVESTSCIFSRTNPDADHGFTVQAYRPMPDNPSERQLSETSGLHLLSSNSGVSESLFDIDAVALHGNRLEARLSAAGDAHIYGIGGELVTVIHLPAGESSTTLDLSPGFYVVKTAKVTAKVILH